MDCGACEKCLKIHLRWDYEKCWYFCKGWDDMYMYNTIKQKRNQTTDKVSTALLFANTGDNA